MPRSNRSKRDRGRRNTEDSGGEFDLSQLLLGSRRVESKGGRDWNVQPMSAVNAQKTYRCPGCNLEIPPGTSHIVVWPDDGIMGAESDLRSRRHWHEHCWRVS
ncbi:MAG: hypothetical protein M9882_05765 [Homoserinimonas sp.]|nr:hypothetical protein [Homoserinimonas sp.]